MSEEGHSGQCRCGAVQFAVSEAPLVTIACHCTGCQRMTASAYSLSSLYPADRFALTSGETVRGGLQVGPDHRFCAQCMSWLYTVPEGLEEFVNVRSPLLENAPGHRPYVDVFRAEGMPWASSGAVRSFETMPQESEFPELMAEYAAWDGRVKQ